jgi:hypothetical protein
MHLEVEAPARIAPALATSEAPFDAWLKERLLEFHGHDLERFHSVYTRGVR